MEVNQKQSSRTKYKKSHKQGTHTNRNDWTNRRPQECQFLQSITIYDSFTEEAKEYNLPLNSRFNLLWQKERSTKANQAVEGLLNQLITQNEELRAEPVEKKSEEDEEFEDNRLWIQVNEYSNPSRSGWNRQNPHKQPWFAQYSYDGTFIRLHKRTYSNRNDSPIQSEENLWLIVQLHFGQDMQTRDLTDKDVRGYCKPNVSGSMRAERRSIQSNGPSKMVGVTRGFEGHDFSNIRFRDCFHPKCVVLMASGDQKFAEDIQAGDIVQTAEGASVVECTVKSVVQSSQFCCIGDGCLVTPSHPVFFDGSWVRPKSISLISRIPVNFVYNFLLESGHTIFINGIECITLGNDAQVHDYDLPSKLQGTSVYANYLRKLPNYPNIVKYCDTK